MEQAGSSVLVPEGRRDAGQLADTLLIQALWEESDRCSPFGFLALTSGEMGWIPFSPDGSRGHAFLAQGHRGSILPIRSHGSGDQEGGEKCVEEIGDFFSLCSARNYMPNEKGGIL